MVIAAQRLTQPLEALARHVQAFGEHESRAPVSPQGTLEVRQLAVDFQAMQARVYESNQFRLESERLATIGSMATSVSHDLRHHLAGIYANAEFLATPGITEDERNDFFADIQAAVMGTTEMLESLTIFSRTGQLPQHVPESVRALLMSAITQVRMHPAAAKFELSMVLACPEACARVDGKQVERALFNLLLNACQSRRPRERACTVTATLETAGECVSISILDNGNGIDPEVQHTLFEPFVSSGKQNGTGPGLTLARRVAQDHGGRVDLVRSDSSETLFRLLLPQTTPPAQPSSEA